jgi:hypothetical protein
MSGLLETGIWNDMTDGMNVEIGKKPDWTKKLWNRQETFICVR